VSVTEVVRVRVEERMTVVIVLALEKGVCGGISPGQRIDVGVWFVSLVLVLVWGLVLACWLVLVQSVSVLELVMIQSGCGVDVGVGVRGVCEGFSTGQGDWC
jgi:hypothetical protein